MYTWVLRKLIVDILQPLPLYINNILNSIQIICFDLQKKNAFQNLEKNGGGVNYA